MSDDAFQRLAPIIQHHVVNDLRWEGLRPVQAETIPHVLDGENVLVLAPTAGGKTEAAFLPLLGMMAERRWRGLSVLYLSPIRALLNNQQPRLQRYAGWLGRNAALWHGDTTAGARKRLREAPPDVLLTTPESIEGMLCSELSEPDTFFAQLQAVVIDEVHGFAAGDRGWHLLGILDRLSAVAGRDLQRIALSATVGNVAELRAWVCRGSARAQHTVRPGGPVGGVAPSPEVTLDFVGSEENAARVIAGLHAGEKRLVFCDSRLQCERLAGALRSARVETHVAHSSLSADERARSERAFSEGRDCVIVATSALELGIDIGDLDRVVQLDAPPAVASFLQRMGRTGRRPGTTPNCLFLATRDRTLVQAAAVIERWRAGVVEPARCPTHPWHLVVQQLFGLLRQKRSIALDQLREVARRLCERLDLEPDEAPALLEHLLDEEWIAEVDATAFIGPRTERVFGARHFLELLSVFSSPPLFNVFHGRHAIGQVHELTFQRRGSAHAPCTFVLGGRPWKVTHLDTKRRRAYVELTDAGKGARWLGTGHAIGGEVAGAMRGVLTRPGAADASFSRRAAARMSELRAEHAWLASDTLPCVTTPDGRAELWTFAGTALNAALARRLAPRLACPVRSDAWVLDIRHGSDSTAGLSAQVEAAWQALAGDPTLGAPVTDDEDGPEKFAQCLPAHLRAEMVRAREFDPDAMRAVLSQRIAAVNLVG